MIKNTTQSYGSVSKWFHWITFLLVLCMILVGFFMDKITNSALQDETYNLHKLTGIAILGLIILRILWTLNNPKPRLPVQTSIIEKILAYSVHGLLYLTLLIMPLSGWLMSTFAGHAPSFFGHAVSFPGIDLNKPTAHLFGNVHLIVAWTLVALISLHVLAGLKHYFIDKDDVFQRMFPKKI